MTERGTTRRPRPIRQWQVTARRLTVAAGLLAALAGLAAAGVRNVRVPLVMVPSVAGAITLGAALVLIGVGAAAARQAGGWRLTLLPVLLAAGMIGWVAVLAATWSAQAGLVQMLRAALAVVVGFPSLLLLCLLAGTAISGRRRPRGAVGFVLVLGSRLVDGDVPPLLAGRLDRAIAVARQASRQASRHATRHASPHVTRQSAPHPVPSRTAPIIIVSGGRTGDRRAEADAMAGYLIARGVPGDGILRERRSRDTAENLAFSHAMMLRRDPHYRCAVVTSDVHALRTALLAHRAGVHGRLLGSLTAWPDGPTAVFREFVLLLSEYRRAAAALCLLLVAVVVIPAAVG